MTTRTVASLTMLLVFVVMATSANAQERAKLSKRPKHGHGLGALPEIHDITAVPASGAIAASLATTADLSANCPPIFNQGGFGSCVSCSTGYCLKGYYEKIEHGWDATQASHQFSPAYLYNQVDGGGDNGSYVSDNFGVMVWRGISTLDVQPYGADVTSWPTQAQCQEAAAYRNGLVGGATYATLANSDLTGIKTVVAGGTPCDICIYVDSAWDGLGSGTNYVWYPNGLSIRGGHCICIIGYDDSRTDGHGHVGAFKVQNSWGTGWGQGGYAWIAYDALSTSGVYSGICYGADKTGDTSTIQAQVQVNHPARGEVRIDIGVGSTSSPAWTYSYYPRLSMGEDNSHANVYTTLDLSAAAAYWPPTSSQPWWVRVTDDNKDGLTGSIAQFTLVNGSTTYNSTTSLPLSIPDGASVYAYVSGAAPVLTSIAVSPVSASVVVGTTQQFTATALDQNGNPFSPQPGFTWNVSGGGTIDGNGLFSATTIGGPNTVTASGGGLTGTASVSVISQPVTPVLHVSNIQMTSTRKSVKATVTVVNTSTGAVVSGATVSGSFSGIVNKSVSGNTSSSGTVTLSASTSLSGSVTFQVKSVSAAGYTYDGLQPSQSITK